MQAQQAVQVVVTRAFHQHLVAWLEQGAHQQVEGVAGALSGEDLLGRGVDADLPQALVQLGTQAGQAQWRAIVDQLIDRATADLTHCLGNRLGGAPAGGHPATAQLEQLARIVRELLPAAVERFVADRLIDQRCLEALFSDKKSGAMARLQPACCHQPVVGFDHAGLADALLPGQLTYRRQAATGTQALAFDPGLQLPSQLLYQRDGGVTIKAEVHGKVFADFVRTVNHKTLASVPCEALLITG
ncbi:hypothetical protein D9M71_483290 [compost metagenome]